MKVVAIIQARLGSSRLPGKCLLALNGKPLLAHVLARASAITGVDEVVLATTWDDRDTALVSLAAACGVRTWRGSRDDVLRRYTEAARFVQADTVMRLTGDCPLLCPKIAALVLTMWNSGRSDTYAWNDTARSGYPDGTDVEVFSRALLELADAQTRHGETFHDGVSNQGGAVREHVTPAIRRLANKVHTVTRPATWASRLKLSVDTPADYARVQAIYAHLRPGRLLLSDTLAAYEHVLSEEI